MPSGCQGVRNLVEPDVADGGGVPTQRGSQRSVRGWGDRQSRRAGDGVSYLGYGLVVGMDVLREFGGAKALEAVAELPDRPAPSLGLGSQAASAQPTAHGGCLGEQREVVHGEHAYPLREPGQHATYYGIKRYSPGRR